MRLFLSGALLGFTLAQAADAAIVEVSIPSTIPLSSCKTQSDGVFIVSAPPYPLEVATGIGWLVNPDTSTYPFFILHQSNFQNLTDAIITMRFDQQTVVDQLDVMQHFNGVSMIELLVGDSIASMSSVGTASVPDNSTEYFVSRFDFDNSTSGLIAQFRITATEAGTGWATYRFSPINAAGNAILPAIPEPATLSLLVAGGLMMMRRSRD